MAIARNTARYTALPTITSGPITALQWNQLTQNTRYIHGTGQLSGSASVPFLPNRPLTLANYQKGEKFFPVILFPGYTFGMIKFRFNLTVWIDNNNRYISEVLTVRIHRGGASQEISKFKISAGQNSVPGASLLPNALVVERYLYFKLDSAVSPQGQSAEVGRISFEFDATGITSGPTSGVYNFQLQTFSECQ